MSQWVKKAAYAAVIAAVLCRPATAEAAGSSSSRIAAALTNTQMLQRPDEEGLATIWDGNKYVQCVREADYSLRCEAAGWMMQPSLASLLTPEKVDRLKKLGWREDSHFGNYVQSFSAKAPVDQVAPQITQTLAEVYDADVEHLEVETNWVAIEPCPPRNGFSQNLAGVINDAPSIAGVAVHACSYKPDPEQLARPVSVSPADLFLVYGARVTGELQRLRINSDRRVYFILSTGAAYLQCESQSEPAAIYCEAVSADSDPFVASILSSERLAKLHAVGYADPGRAPNYWKVYALDKSDDVTIARELLAILHDVYGYTALQPLKFSDEKNDDASD